MKTIDKRFIPKYISALSNCEIFVFGSNLEGHHYGGAAKLAFDKFGAEWGIGSGPTGKCYAIPTMHGGISKIKPYIDEFIEYAKSHPNNRFLLTRVGCGIAGFKDEDIAPLFKGIFNIPNISFPFEWFEYVIDCNEPARKRDKAPDALDEDIFKTLCDNHIYEIGAGINNFLPHIKIRYVIGRDKFGYAKFGDFFFFNNELYVWHHDDGWAKLHNQNVVMEYFHDECIGRGYAVKHIFAGVKTNFKDIKNEYIYTGDVLRLKRKDTDYFDPIHDILALGTSPLISNKTYSFLLDNHHWDLESCMNSHVVKRIGTVFYQLNEELHPTKLNYLTLKFNGFFDSNEERLDKALNAKFTPNLDKENWKYKALDSLGVEFNWKH